MPLLPNFLVHSRAGEKWSESGIDSLERCIDKDHFVSYPFPVEYHYNNRGFRDQNWPTDLTELKTATWCIGDSFTAGIGSPLEHTWPYILGKNSQRKTLNIGMDGASNSWISDRCVELINTINPTNIVVMWSYIHRRQGRLGQNSDRNRASYQREPAWKRCYNSIREPAWPEVNDLDGFYQLPPEICSKVFLIIGEQAFRDDLTIQVHYEYTSNQEDVEHLQRCVDAVQQAGGQRVIHAMIPGLAPKDVFAQCWEIVQKQTHSIPHFAIQDLARDGHHFDRITADWVAKQAQDLLL